MAKDILFIDVDSKHGDLYLMQLSTYHKSKGDRVHFGTYPNPDIVYVGCMFSKNGADARGISTYFPDSEVYIGGTGINLNGGDSKIAKLKPDYDLYPDMKFAMGRTTWGCPNKCPWCVVPQKEGKFKRWMHPSEFYDDRFKSIYLLDNTINCDKEWFIKVTDWFLDQGVKIAEINMDFRYLDIDIAERLKEVKFDCRMHFAWDWMHMEDQVIKGIEILKSVGIITRNDVSVYVLTQYNTTKEQDLYRVKTLRELNVNPFVMVYGKADKWHKKLQWIVARKKGFWTDSWDREL